MTLDFPWIELIVLLPLVASLGVVRLHDPDVARQRSLLACSVTLVCAIGAWADFHSRHVTEAFSAWDLLAAAGGQRAFVLDSLNAPLVVLASLLYLLTVLATLRTKVRRFSFAGMLVSESILLATLSSEHPWVIVGLLSAGTIPPLVELRARHRPKLMFAGHMALFVALLIAGQAMLASAGDAAAPPVAAAALLMAAVLLRSGVVPVHCWMTELFEHASFGTALLFVAPMVGAYAAIRMVLPIAPDWMLRAATILSLATALYAAGMALVQTEARRFFCYVFLSHASLVFVGLEMLTPLGLTGALCVWLSVELAMAGFGLTLRSIEARTGRLSLKEFHGLVAHTPRLAALFLITGLASIGFPGTAGFVGAELLIDSAVQVEPLTAIAIAMAAALNGLAIMHAYFRVFTGTRHAASIDLRSRPSERIAVLVLTVLILGGGLYPQPGVTSRYDVARQLLAERQQRLGASTTAPTVEVARPKSSWPTRR